jgi:hypothetical protein
MNDIVGTVPFTYTFSLQDVANVVGYNNLVDCEANDSAGSFPGGNSDINTLRHYRGYFRGHAYMSFSNVNDSILICPYIGKRILILQITSFASSVRPINSPTLNGVAFTHAGNNNRINRSEIWYMLNPPVGTYNLYIPTDGLIAYSLHTIPYINSVSLYSTAFQSGTSTTPSITSTTPATESIFVDNWFWTHDVPPTNWVGPPNWMRMTFGYGLDTNGAHAEQNTGVYEYSNPTLASYQLQSSVVWQVATAVFSIT